jgi:hypothetical protein
MLKQVMIGLCALFALSAVVILGTEEPAQAQSCKYWGRVGGSLCCLAYGSGSVYVDASIDCEDPDLCDISAPVKVAVSLFGNVVQPSSGPCDFNSQCGMDGTLVCDDEDPEPTTLLPSDVHFPLTGEANMNCQSGECTTSFEIELKKCQGNAANCCFGDNCCPKKTKSITFIPNSFDAAANFSQPPGQVSGEAGQTLTIDSANCTLDSYSYSPSTYSCICVGEDCVPPEEECGEDCIF